VANAKARADRHYEADKARVWAPGADPKRGNAVDSDLSLFDVLVATVIAILAAVWIIAFAGFWRWGADLDRHPLSLSRWNRAPQPSRLWRSRCEASF